MKKKAVCIFTAIVIALSIYIPSFGATYTHSSAFKGQTVHKGIDVSQYQGSIDWEQVKKSGIDFAIIRAGYRDRYNGNLCVDEKFRDNIRDAKNSGIRVGIYYRTQALTVSEAKEEAASCLKLIDEYDIELPVFYDVEAYVRNRPLFDGDHKVLLANIANAFLDRMAEEGYYTGMYSCRNSLENHISTGKITAKGHVIWVAEWNTKTPYKGKYCVWQYTSNGTVSGIDGRVDRDFLYGDKYFRNQKQDQELSKVAGLSKESRTEASYTIGWVGQKAADGYIIYRADRYGGTYKEIGRTKDVSYQDTKVKEGRQYSYKVAAYDAEGTAAKSASHRATVLPAYDRYGKLKKGRNMRKNPGTSYSVVKSLKKGASVTILGYAYDKNGDKWYKVKYKSSGKTYYGYIKAGVFTITKKCTTSGNVNLRKGPGTGYGIYGTVPRGKCLVIRGIRTVGSRDWYKVKYKIGKKTRTGYISSKYGRAVNI